MSASIRRFLLAAMALTATAWAGQAHAQIMAGPGAGMKAAKGSAGIENSQKTPPPPALPGARVDKETVAPAERPPSEMQPTEALFDAINRGDIATARDAISRGAEIDSKNVLGLTPLELSIDLGRRDISFLLLSMRGAPGTASRPPQQADATGRKGKPAKEARTEMKAERVRARTADEAAAPPPRAPKLYAGDGGAPVPNAGFLGFGGSARSP